MYRVPIQKVQLVRDSSVMIPNAKLNDADASAHLAHELIGTPDREHMIVIGMNAKNRVIGTTIIAIGAESYLSTTVACVLRPVLLMGARAFILAHNHPSGDVYPSREDIEVTRRITKGARAVDLQLVDHVIIGVNESGTKCHYSLHANNMME